tara:strand:- start:2060 stop:4033 length:1974 start_codon:yes stop_codon:yes gene_type:complete
MSETATRLRKKYGIKEPSINYKDVARMFFGQGLGFRFGDEAIGTLRGYLDPDLTIDEAIAEERAEVERIQRQFPKTSMALEIGGAFVPGLTLSIFSGGTMAPVTLGRMATVGAGSSFVYGLGGKEGSTITERVMDKPAELVGETLTGAVAGPLAAKTMQAIAGAGKAIAQPILRKIKGQVGNKAEKELQRIAEESAVSIDDIIAGVAQGKIIPEISPELAANIKALYSKGTRGAGEIAKKLEERAIKKPAEVFSGIQKDLSGSAEGNVKKLFQANQSAFASAESKAYNEIYDKFKNFKSNNLNLAILQIANINRSLRSKMNELHRATGGDGNLFKIDDKGVLTLTGDVSLEMAEKIRGILFDRQARLFKDGDGTLGKEVRLQENALRKIIDDISPDLKQTRLNWSNLKKGNDNFKIGETIFNKSADDAEIIIDNILSTGNTNAIEGLKLGALSNIRKLASGNRKANFINQLVKTEPPSRERIILSKLYPQESLEEILNKADVAAGALMAKGKILNTTITAPTLEKAKRIGTSFTLSDAGDVMDLLQGTVGGGMRLIRKILPGKSAQLSDSQLAQVAKLILQEDVELLKNSLRDKSARDMLTNKVERVIDSIIGGTVTGTAPLADEDINITGSAQASEFLQDVPMSARRKILDSLDMT